MQVKAVKVYSSEVFSYREKKSSAVSFFKFRHGVNFPLELLG